MYFNHQSDQDTLLEIE